MDGNHMRFALMLRVAWELYLRHGKNVHFWDTSSVVYLWIRGCFGLSTLDTLIKGGQLQGDQAWACVPYPIMRFASLFKRRSPRDYARQGRPPPWVKPRADRIPCSPSSWRVLTWVIKWGVGWGGLVSRSSWCSLSPARVLLLDPFPLAASFGRFRDWSNCLSQSLSMDTKVFQQPESHKTSASHFNRIDFRIPSLLLSICCQFCVAQFLALIGLFNWILPWDCELYNVSRLHWRGPEYQVWPKGGGCNLRWKD